MLIKLLHSGAAVLELTQHYCVLYVLDVQDLNCGMQAGHSLNENRKIDYVHIHVFPIQRS
jgi:hypothetical protein